MQGSYITKAQRQEVTKQRSRTSVKLGCDKNSNSTTMGNSYLTYKAEAPPSSQDIQKSFMKAHFAIGQSRSTKALSSEAHSKYKKHSLAATQSPESMDLKQQNFTLGKKNPSYSTTSSQLGKPNSIEVDSKNSKSRKDLMKHNFQLGSGKTSKLSVFAASYKEAQSSVENQAKSSAELKKSHFIMGKSPASYLSTNQLSYYPMEDTHTILDKNQIQNLNSKHFTLGSEKPLFSSTTTSTFTQKTQGKQSLNQEKLKDLRSSHIKLGGDKTNYNPCSSDFKPLSTRVESPKNNSVSLRFSSFKLGNESPSFNTAYSQNYKPAPKTAYSQKRNPNSEYRSTFNLGKQQGNTLSVMKASYLPHEQAAVPKVEMDLKRTNWAFAKEKPLFKTTSGDYGKYRGEPPKLNFEASKDLRATHFTYGSNPPVLLSSNMKDFKPHTAFSPVRNSRSEKELRSHHYTLGGDSQRWATEQKSNFKWVQPVPSKLN